MELKFLLLRQTEKSRDFRVPISNGALPFNINADFFAFPNRNDGVLRATRKTKTQVGRQQSLRRRGENAARCYLDMAFHFSAPGRLRAERFQDDPAKIERSAMRETDPLLALSGLNDRFRSMTLRIIQ